MIRKNDLAALQQQVQAYAPARDVILSDDTSLLFYGLLDSVDRAHFDVSATLFEAAAYANNSFIAKVEGRRMIQIGDRLPLHEGVYGGGTNIDGVTVYDLKSLYTRFAMRGKGTTPDAFAAKIIAASLAALMETTVSTVVPQPTPVKPVPTWGELDEAEQAYEARCQRADWYYSYSDDNRVYRAGKAVCDDLKSKANEMGGNYALIHCYYSTR